MTKVTFKRDAAGIAAFLKSSEVRTVVRDAAHRVAAGVDKPAEVSVSDYTTDRAAASVTIVDGRAKVWQIRDGVLTRALAAAGLEWGRS